MYYNFVVSILINEHKPSVFVIDLMDYEDEDDALLDDLEGKRYMHGDAHRESGARVSVGSAMVRGSESSLQRSKFMFVL